MAKEGTKSEGSSGVGILSSENLANKSIVEEYGLSLEITQSPEDLKTEHPLKVGRLETPQVRRSTRESRAPVRYFPSANYLLMTDNGEPESHSEALSTKESIQWKKAINEEIISLEKNQTLSPLVWITNRKRLLEQCGCSGVMKSMMAEKAFEDLHLEQLDVKTAFLHGDLDEDIYLIQLEGFQSVGKEENLLCKLKKSLYGLKHRDNASDMAEIKKLKRQLKGEHGEVEGEVVKVAATLLLIGSESLCQLPDTASIWLFVLGWPRVVCFHVERSPHHEKISLQIPVGESEETLYLKKILGEKNPADMLTNVVITEKLKLCAASTSLRDN
ncbi:putative RNA-directed DNA polymerase [Tanacetum coccineum]